MMILIMPSWLVASVAHVRVLQLRVTIDALNCGGARVSMRSGGMAVHNINGGTSRFEARRVPSSRYCQNHGTASRRGVVGVEPEVDREHIDWSQCVQDDRLPLRNAAIMDFKKISSCPHLLGFGFYINFGDVDQFGFA
jgi:hypothetical protein